MSQEFKPGDKVHIKISFWIKLRLVLTYGPSYWLPSKGEILRWDSNCDAYEVGVDTGPCPTLYVVPEQLNGLWR